MHELEIKSLPNLEQFLNSFTDEYKIYSHEHSIPISIKGNEIESEEGEKGYFVKFDFPDKTDKEFKNISSKYFEKFISFSSDYYYIHNFFIGGKTICYDIHELNPDEEITPQTKIGYLHQFKEYFFNVQAWQKTIHFSQNDNNESFITITFYYKSETDLEALIVEAANKLKTLKQVHYKMSGFNTDNELSKKVTINWADNIL